MNRFEAAVFDFDGTVMDSGPGIMRVAGQVADEMGFPSATDAQMRRFIGPPLAQCFEVVYQVPKDVAQKAADRYRILYDETDAISEASLYPGIRELLENLRDAGVRTAVASAKRIPLLERMLRHYDAAELFDAVEGAPADLSPANKEDIILRTLERLGTDRNESLMIGDSAYDAVAARADKMPFCGVLWGFGFEKPEQINSAYPGSYVVRAPADLQRLVLGE